MLYDPKDYLRHIVDEMDIIATIVENKDLNSFLNDITATRAAFACMTIIGEAEKQVDATFRAQHPDIPWTYMARMRDRLIHGYVDVDYRILWDTMTTDLPSTKLKLIELINLPS